MNRITSIALAGLTSMFVAAGVGVIVIAFFSAYSFWQWLGWRGRDVLALVAGLGALPVARECFHNAADIWSYRTELRDRWDTTFQFPRARARKRRWRPSVIP